MDEIWLRRCMKNDMIQPIPLVCVTNDIWMFNRDKCFKQFAEALVSQARPSRKKRITGVVRRFSCKIDSIWFQWLTKATPTRMIVPAPAAGTD
jgi:hypothetical protein